MQLVSFQMTIEQVEKLLISSVKDRQVYRDAIAVVERLRETSAKANDENKANQFWRYKSLLEIKEGYIGVFEKIKNDQHMGA